MTVRNVAVVLGGGMGRRVGARRPKQFEDVAGRPVMAWTLDIFEHLSDIDGVVVVVPPDWVDFTRALLARIQYSKVLDVVPGGATRQMSSFSGLILAQRFGGAGLKKVLIHDAVRPLTPPDLVSRVVRALDHPVDGQAPAAATAAFRVSDTLLRVGASEKAGDQGRTVIETVDRSPLWHAQTPQAFVPSVIMDAHRRALTDGVTDATDDVGLVLRIGGNAVVVESDPGNMKITHPCDVEMLKVILRMRAE